VSDDSVIPLFPLHTVLFPGGPLPLRIFETRYLDMVRRCAREERPFGVVLIQEGEEAGEVATTATVGCAARIVDFSTLPDGLLGIACVGGRRFRALRVWREADGLNMAEISWLAIEPEPPVPPDCLWLRDAVSAAMRELATQYEHVEKRSDDAAWIGFRLAELLPLSLADRQALLEIDDPLKRLAVLRDLVPGEESGENGER
jgi:Lon protease-like protein